MLRRSAYFGSGLTLMAAGLVSVPTPVPIGFVLFLAGLYLVARGSRRARRAFGHLRRRAPGLAARFDRLRAGMPPALRGLVERRRNV